MKELNDLKMSNITQKWVNTLKPFSRDYDAKMTGSTISRLSGFPQQTVSRYMDKLVALNLVSYVKDGKNKLFYLDLRKQQTKILLNIVENQRSLVFMNENKIISPIIQELLGYCNSIIIFGSYASGKYTKTSDLDIVIVGNYDKKKIKYFRNRQNLEINEHYVSFSELKSLLKKKNPLAIEIMHNHILFGDVSKLIDFFIEVHK